MVNRSKLFPSSNRIESNVLKYYYIRNVYKHQRVPLFNLYTTPLEQRRTLNWDNKTLLHRKMDVGINMSHSMDTSLPPVAHLYTFVRLNSFVDILRLEKIQNNIYLLLGISDCGSDCQSLICLPLYLRTLISCRTSPRTAGRC